MSLPSVDLLRKKFLYNPETGIVTRREPAGWKRAGDTVGHLANGSVKAYLSVHIGTDEHRLHRVIWKLFYGTDPVGQIDHIDGNGRNNRIDNLRLVDQTENHRNQRMRRNNTSGCLGIAKCRNKWRSYITVNRRQIHLGIFETLEEAISARKKAERLYGFHDRHGEVRPAYTREEALP